jgi:hypothetical protein
LRQQSAGAAAERRQHQVLREQLAHEPRAAGADGGADGDLARAGARARQHQAGHVGAGDDQHQSRGCQQDQQLGAEAGGGGLGEEGAVRAVLALGSGVRPRQAHHD